MHGDAEFRAEILAFVAEIKTIFDRWPIVRCDDVKAVTIYAKFRIGDIVYLRLANEKRDGMVIGLNVRETVRRSRRRP